MSAIAGLLHMRGQPVEPSNLERMSAALAAHGPDGQGVWNRKAVGLIHRRRNATPEDSLGHSPLASPDGQIVLTSAARLDNRPELACELSLTASQIAALPDSQFILKAYLRWGYDCAEHLIGDFTFAVWDDREQSLLLACSPFSGRPLFYHASGGRFAFATMPKGLFALPGIPRALDEEFLAHYLARLPTPPGATFYYDIHRLIPGHRLVVRDGHLDSHSFWEPDLTNDLRLSRDEDYLEAFHALFTRVVGDHTRSASPVGIMLSGGLDSSSVAAGAAPLLRAERKRLAAFTEVPRLGFDVGLPVGRYADETTFVQAITRMYDTIDLNLVQTDNQHLLQGIECYFHYAETPFWTPCNRLWVEAILSEAQHQGVRVLLSGGQGNLSISWQGTDSLPNLMRRGQFGAALRESRQSVADVQPVSVLRTLLGRGVLPLLPSAFQVAFRWARTYGTRRSYPPSSCVLRPEYARRHGISEGSRIHPANTALRSQWESRQMRLDIMRWTTSLSSLSGTGYQARYDVEVRDPTCDVRLVEFCLSLPEEQFRLDGMTRRLLRKAMEGRLPPEILSNSKRGLQAADWAERMAQSREELAAGLAGVEGCALAREMIDVKGVREALTNVCHLQERGEPVTIELRNYLEDGFMVGSFIRWFEAGGD